MDIKKAFADKSLERDGVWVSYRDGSEIKIARIGNSNFQNRHEKLMVPHRRDERRGRLSAETQMEVLCRAMAGTVLLDWKNFTSGGKAFKFTEENAYNLLIDSIDFRNDIVELATDEEHFKREFDEESEGNSSPPSNGG